MRHAAVRFARDAAKRYALQVARRVLPRPIRSYLRQVALPRARAAQARLSRTVPARWRYPGVFAQTCLRTAGFHLWRRLTPREQMYVDFALSTNERGAWTADVIQRFKDLRGTRCLDIGCAYGGFLVALWEREAREVVGIDVGEGLLALARLNLEERRVPADLRLLNVEKPDIAEELGQFDVVVMNDVLEHVLDLPRAIENTCRLVAPGGLLFAVIPNRYFVRYVLKDGHYRLPGLTLLSRRDAALYYETDKVQDRPYGVGYYRTYRYYERRLRKGGLSVELFPAGVGVYELPQLRREFEEVCRFFADFRDPAVPAPIAAKIVRRAGIVYGTFQQLVRRHDELLRDAPDAAAHLADRIIERYGMEAWHVVGRRPE